MPLSTAAWIGIASAVVAAAGTAYSQVQASNAASQASKFNEQVAANNAQIALQNANWASQAGEQQAAAAQQKTRATVGAIKTAQAASGVDVNTGSAVDVRSSAASLGELDAINIRSNAARQAYGYQTSSASETAKSQLDQYTAQNDVTAGQLNAAGTIIGGAGSAASDYANYRQNNSGNNISGNSY